MVDKKLSQFDEVSTGEVSYFPVLDGNTKNAKIAGTKAMPWTNCITEIPQDIKLSLNNGTLTLLAGSKVYVPNGPGVFDVVTIDSDMSLSPTELNRQDMFCFRPNGNAFNYNIPKNFYSGSVAPSVSQYMTWYDTANNLVKLTSDSGSTWISGYSLPIGLFTSTSKIDSIDQVFNGFGYIGSTVFALPGVKGLIPNGRNEDGTLKNIEFTTNVVKTHTQQTQQNEASIYLSDSAIFSSSYRTYDEINNLILNNSNQKQYICCIGSLKRESSSPYRITSFTQKTPFHAVDYSEFKAAKDDMMTLSTSQTVSAGKTITGQFTFKGGSRCVLQQTNIDISTIPATPQYGNTILLKDKNGQIIGYIDSAQFTSGQIYTRLGAIVYTSGGETIYTSINVGGNLSGDKWVEVPTPSSVEDNSNKVVSTQWFNNKIKVVSALPANPVNGVFYFITD